jgi:hypothetical protein
VIIVLWLSTARRLFLPKIVFTLGISIKSNQQLGLVMSLIFTVERIDLASFGKKEVRLKVVAADLGRRHKCDNFNSFLTHLFF